MDDVTKELEEIRKRVEAATPGEWIFVEPFGVGVQGDSWLQQMLVELPSFAQPLTTEEAQRCKTDYTFIAHARQDIPRLLTIIDEQEREIQVAREEGLHWADAHDARFKEVESLRTELAKARRNAFDEAIVIVSSATNYSDGDGLRSLDPRGLDQIGAALEAARDAESKGK